MFRTVTLHCAQQIINLGLSQNPLFLYFVHRSKFWLIENNVLETEMVLFWGEGRETSILLGPIERANLNHLPHVKTEADPVSEEMCFLVTSM
jgi:hypothetical protein